MSIRDEIDAINAQITGIKSAVSSIEACNMAVQNLVSELQAKMRRVDDQIRKMYLTISDANRSDH